MANSAVAELQSALANALSSPASGGLLASLFHSTASSAGLNVKDKTITTTFVANNQSTAILLEAEGYTIVVG